LGGDRRNADDTRTGADCGDGGDDDMPGDGFRLYRFETTFQFGDAALHLFE
jgi:hypothetical protein